MIEIIEKGSFLIQKNFENFSEIEVLGNLG